MEIDAQPGNPLRFRSRTILLRATMPYEPTWKERIEDARVYIGPALAVVIVLVVAGWVTWHELGRPEDKPRASMDAGGGAISPETQKAVVATEVEVIEKTYER